MITVVYVLLWRSDILDGLHILYIMLDNTLSRTLGTKGTQQRNALT